MALFERTVYSPKLGKTNSFRVYVPEKSSGLLPVVFFHHGLGYSGNTWWTDTQLEKKIAKYGMIIVTADAEDSWFINDLRAGGGLWEDYFAFELPEYIENEFPASPKKESRGQCGFSMGGYGAMMLSLLHPDRFSAVSTHSGSFVFGHEYRRDRPERAELMSTSAPPGGKYDLFRIISGHCIKYSDMPSIRMDIGRDDYLLDQDRRFDACLSENGVEHIYTETNGSHSWNYVDQQLDFSLDFFSETLCT